MNDYLENSKLIIIGIIGIAVLTILRLPVEMAEKIVLPLGIGLLAYLRGKES